MKTKQKETIQKKNLITTCNVYVNLSGSVVLFLWQNAPPQKKKEKKKGLLNTLIIQKMCSLRS